MNEITIEIRNLDRVSIQGPGVKGKQDEVKALLETALKALENAPDSQHTNELVFKTPKQ